MTTLAPFALHPVDSVAAATALKPKTAETILPALPSDSFNSGNSRSEPAR